MRPRGAARRPPWNFASEVGHVREVPEAGARAHHTARLTMMIQVMDDRAMIRDADETDGRMRRLVGTVSGGRWRRVVMGVAVEDEISL